MSILVKRGALNASLLIWDAVLAIQRDCGGITCRLSFVCKVTYSVDARQPPAKVKQVVLPFKVIGFAYQSRPLSKVKQLVLLYQVIAFHYQSLIPCITVSAISTHKKAYLDTDSMVPIYQS